MANKKTSGATFSADEIQRIWEKGRTVEGEDPRFVRQDICGAIIHRNNYGSDTVPKSFSWEIDHIKPVSLGGTDDFQNLQPLQWENNRHKGNNYPEWQCIVVASDKSNGYNV